MYVYLRKVIQPVADYPTKLQPQRPLTVESASAFFHLANGLHWA
jgi:hypothetical protein